MRKTPKIIMFIFIINTILFPHYVNANTNLNSNYGLNSGKNVTNNGSDVTVDFNQSGLLNTITGSYTYTDSEVEGYTEWRGCVECLRNRGEGVIGNFKYNYTQKGFITYGVSNNYTFAGGGIGFNINYINQLYYELYPEVSCNTLKFQVGCPGEFGCVYWIQEEQSPACTSVKEIVNTVGGAEGARAGAKKLYENMHDDYFTTESEYYQLMERLRRQYKYAEKSTNIYLGGNLQNENKTIERNICQKASNPLADKNCWGYSLDSWNENTMIQTKYKVQLNNAYLNKLTGAVKYTSAGNTLTDTSNYISEGPKYYIDLDYTKDQFNIKSNSTDLSSFSGVKWTANFNYNIDILHNYYKVNNNRIKGFAFKYRSIDLNNAFPNNNASDNWINYIRDDLYIDQTYPNDNSKKGETYIINDYIGDNLEKYGLKDTNGKLITPVIRFSNKSTMQYQASITSDDMKTIRVDNTNGYYQYGYTNGYLDIGGSSTFNIDYRTNGLKYYKIGCGRDYNGLPGGGCP